MRLPLIRENEHHRAGYHTVQGVCLAVIPGRRETYRLGCPLFGGVICARLRSVRMECFQTIYKNTD
jgi:hypothetical protein